jgi:hypothetical protein
MRYTKLSVQYKHTKLIQWSRIVPEQSNRSSAIQNIPCILWNQKCHYQIHKSAPSAPILKEINAVNVPIPILQRYILPSHLHPGLLRGLFSTGFFAKHLKPSMQLCSPPQVLHATPVSLLLITRTMFNEGYRS